MRGSNGYIVGGRIGESLGQSAVFFRKTREPLRHLHGDGRSIESNLCAVIEEDSVEDLAGSQGQIQEDLGDTDDSFDVRDLLLDESD
jgi:hypothetical protein